jgi:FtsZ-interacting cell division protein YlmF
VKDDDEDLLDIDEDYDDYDEEEDDDEEEDSDDEPNDESSNMYKSGTDRISKTTSEIFTGNKPREGGTGDQNRKKSGPANKAVASKNNSASQMSTNLVAREDNSAIFGNAKNSSISVFDFKYSFNNAAAAH